ncbi:MAG: biotin--[acetyl-CoA-carboxylase] ligase, partial [Zetaproteobacteria bacterium]
YRRDLRLKWPNDVLAPEGKVAGILVEAKSADDHLWAAIGIGVNIRPPRGGFPAWAGEAAALVSAGKAPAREAIAQAIAESWLRLIPIWEREGFPALRARWWAAHGGARKVRVRTAQGMLEGTAEAIREDGALVVRTDREQVAITLGEVEAVG